MLRNKRSRRRMTDVRNVHSSEALHLLAPVNIHTNSSANEVFGFMLTWEMLFQNKVFVARVRGPCRHHSKLGCERVREV